MQDNAPRDPGLQPERTGLAWSRTGLLAFLVATLSVRVGLSVTDLAHLLTALLLAGLGAAALRRGHQRARYTANEEVVTAASRAYILATSAIVAIACLSHIALLFARYMRTH
jgi:hypothetical protein